MKDYYVMLDGKWYSYLYGGTFSWSNDKDKATSLTAAQAKSVYDYVMLMMASPWCIQKLKILAEEPMPAMVEIDPITMEPVNCRL